MTVRYLVEYEINSHGILDGGKQADFHHPRKPVSIHIIEKSVNLNNEYAVLTAYLLFEAESLNDAHARSDGVLSDFIDTLTFATSMDFQIHRKLKIIDWSVGTVERTCWVFTKAIGDDRPYKVINSELIETLQIISSLELEPAIRRALRWFSIGVSAKFMDEQFQSFWFVVEILAQVVKPTEKIHDKCAVCGNHLYCEGCKAHPKHKPYAKQAIKSLFGKVISDRPDDAFNICNDVRNRLLHGNTIESIEQSTGKEFDEHVDGIGRVAWYSLRNMLKILLSQAQPGFKLHFLETTTFCEMVGQVRAIVTYTSERPDDPRFGEWPDFRFEAVRGARDGGT